MVAGAAAKQQKHAAENAAKAPVVPRGYKRTELGVIPEDWEVNAIGQLMKLINGRAFKPEDWKHQGIPIIRIQNLNDHECEFNYCATPVEEKHRIIAGDILFAWSGTTGTSFGARIWNGATGVLNQHIFKVIADPRKLTSFYSFLILKKAQEDIEKQAHGFKASFVHVKKADLIKIFLPVPSLPEQQAIAQVLSDVDGWVASLDALIAKKRAIKTATMQQLLTGRTRLSGFSGEWEERKLGQIFDIKAGKSKNNNLMNGGRYIVADMGAVSSGGYLIATKRTNNKEDALQVGDLVMPKDDIGGGFIIGKVAYIDQNDLYVLGDHVYRLRNFEGDSKFLSYLINSHQINTSLRKKVSGSAQLGISRKSVEEQEMVIPLPKEQTAIANILSDMDAEIDLLEAKREKAVALKQGMMQELLTGKTRLI